MDLIPTEAGFAVVIAQGAVPPEGAQTLYTAVDSFVSSGWLSNVRFWTRAGFTVKALLLVWPEVTLSLTVIFRPPSAL